MMSVNLNDFSLLLFLACSSFSPRRFSPRLASRSTLTKADNNHEGFQVYIFEVLKGMNLSKTSEAIHDVPKSCDLSTLQKKLKNMESKVFLPNKGLYWLRKGNKQMVQLKDDHDWKCCQKEYSDTKGNISSVRIACVAVEVNDSG